MTFTQKILKMNDRETKECAQAMWIIKQFLMNVRIFRQKACGVKGFCSGLCNVNHNVHCNEAEIDGCQTNLGCQPFGCDCDNSAYKRRDNGCNLRLGISERGKLQRVLPNKYSIKMLMLFLAHS